MKKFRIAGLLVGLAALAAGSAAPAQAASQSRQYAVGGIVMGTGVTWAPNAALPAIGGVTFSDVTTGATVQVKIADAHGGDVGATVSFRGAPSELDPLGEISSANMCGKTKTLTRPAGTQRVVVFLHSAYPETPATNGFGCPAGKVLPATTGTVTITY